MLRRVSAPVLIVIFGAAVRADGQPSSTLMRRIGYGFRAAQAHPEASVLCSGGMGRVGPSEASVMAQVLLGWGVPAERLILDERSLDTLQSVVVVARRVRAAGVEAIVCSDGYHLPRIRTMLTALGVRNAAGPFRRGPAGGSLLRWIGMSLRECAALPYDMAIVLARRRSLLA